MYVLNVLNIALYAGVQNNVWQSAVFCSKSSGNRSKIRTSGGKNRVFVIMKREHEETNEDDDNTTEDTRKPRNIWFDTTFKKWKCNLDKEFNTVTWLESETLMASEKKMV